MFLFFIWIFSCLAFIIFSWTFGIIFYSVFSFFYFLSDIQSYFQMQISESLGICSDQIGTNSSERPYKEINRSEKARQREKRSVSNSGWEPKKKPKNFFHLSGILFFESPTTVTDFLLFIFLSPESCEAFKIDLNRTFSVTISGLCRSNTGTSEAKSQLVKLGAHSLSPS